MAALPEQDEAAYFEGCDSTTQGGASVDRFMQEFWGECLRDNRTFAMIRENGDVDVFTVAERDDRNPKWNGFSGEEWHVLMPEVKGAYWGRSTEFVPMVEVRTNNMWHRGSLEGAPECLKKAFVKKGLMIRLD